MDDGTYTRKRKDPAKPEQPPWIAAKKYLAYVAEDTGDTPRVLAAGFLYLGELLERLNDAFL